MFTKLSPSGITGVVLVFLVLWMALAALVLPHESAPETWLVREALFVVPAGIIVYGMLRRGAIILRLGEARYRELFEDHPDAMCVFNEAGRIVHFNRAMVARYGYTEEELLNISAVDLAAEELRPRVPQLAKQTLNESMILEWRHRCKGGRELPVEIHSRPMVLEGRRCVVSSIRDISERKAVETEAMRNEQRSALAQRIAGIGVWEWDIRTDRLHWTPEVYQMFGVDSASIRDVLDDVAPCIYPDDRPLWQESVHRCVELGVEHNLEFRVVGADGRVRWLSTLGNTERDDNGRATRMLGVVMDVTARKQAEAEIAASAQRFRSLFDAMIEGAAVHELVRDTSGRVVNYRILETNPAYERQTGISRKCLVGCLATEAYNTAAPPYLDRFESVVRTRSSEVFEDYFAPIGRIFRVSVFSLAADQFVTVFEDVTESRRAADALRESERVLATLISNLPGMAYRCRNNQNWEMIFLSDGCADLTGYSSAQLTDGTGPDYAALIHPDDRVRVWQQVQTALQRRQSFELTYRIRTASGAERWVWERGRGVGDDDQGVCVVIEGFIADITEKKKAEAELLHLEAQLRQAQKMEAVGQLAGGVAHDFNNILTAILGNVELARVQVSGAGGDTLIEELDQIERSANRAASLTRQLLAFSRRQIAQPRNLDLNDVLHDMEKMLRRVLTEHIALHFVHGAALHAVHVDPGHIEQVLMNLVVNARDAMPDGGKLTIETSNVFLDADYAAARAEVQSGAYVALTVSDTGRGMDAETVERVFEPFFTTKDMGHGTGLGLSTVYGIVKQAGGHVAVYSESGRGATFRVYLPALAEPVEATPQAEPRLHAVGGHETILLCEDDESVRMLAMTMLQRAGYEVLAAANGEDAQMLAKQHRGSIDLLVTDVIMPDINGRELSNALTRVYPELRTLYISGYTANVIAHHGVLDEGVAFLEKPFSRVTLLDRVRGMLDAD